jgi:predicted 3-demethylubiquinone-9 3-methyltransferase (glyoxalase superfamily)
MASKLQIAPCLWFDTQAEEAAKLYVSIFPDSKIDKVSYYVKEGVEVHGKAAGSVLTVDFHIGQSRITALNGGPQFKFSEAVSLQVFCETQQEIDRYWSELSQGGSEGPCGWLRDKFGLSWQVVPSVLHEMIVDRDTAKVERVTKAYLQMRKFDIAALRRAYEGR